MSQNIYYLRNKIITYDKYQSLSKQPSPRFRDEDILSRTQILFCKHILPDLNILIFCLLNKKEIYIESKIHHQYEQNLLKLVVHAQ